MKTRMLLFFAISLAIISGCQKDIKSEGKSSNNFDHINTKAADYAASSLPKDTISGLFTYNITLTNDKVWYLRGVVAIDYATITIEPGTVIVGLTDANSHGGTLVICRHASIDAQGTSSAPIVFTSKNLVDGNTFTTATPGDYAGLIILGQAPVNVADKTLDGLDFIGAFDNRYGGSNPTHSSGILKYTRIEFGGAGGNALTFGGVGSGTVVDHVQVSYSKSDSFVFFGGTVNCSYLVALAAFDDNFDITNGYRGTIQYAVAVGDIYAPHSASGTTSESQGIEIDNNFPEEDATFALTPKTHPIFKNLTVVGAEAVNVWVIPGYQYAIWQRRGSEIELYNSILLGYREAINFDVTTQGFFTTGVSKIQNNILSAFTTAVNPTSFNTSIDSQGNRRNVFATNSNGFARLAQPYVNDASNQINLIPTSASPATAGGWGAFNNTSRPNWFTTTWVKWYF